MGRQPSAEIGNRRYTADGHDLVCADRVTGVELFRARHWEGLVWDIHPLGDAVVVLINNTAPSPPVSDDARERTVCKVDAQGALLWWAEAYQGISHRRSYYSNLSVKADGRIVAFCHVSIENWIVDIDESDGHVKSVWLYE
jgi:hypothetical protein